MFKRFVFFALLFVFAITSLGSIPSARGTEAELVTFGAVYGPSMKFSSTAPNQIYGETGERLHFSGDNTAEFSFGIGFRTVSSFGFSTEASYNQRMAGRTDYRPKKTAVGIADTSGSAWFEYTIRDFSLRFRKTVVSQWNSSLYMGCGFSLVLFTFHENGRDFSASPRSGLTGYPLIGVEVFTDRMVNVYAEFAYYFGRTIKEDSSDYYYSLRGPEFRIGVGF